MIIVIIASVLICLLYVFSTKVRCGPGRMGALYDWKYAHRGLHGNGVPENSLEAFRRAREHGYGIELDVHLLADGNLAVIHDFSLKRLCGMNGVIEELTASQLKDCYLEGTMQTIPSFRKVLELLDGRVPIIVELKAAGKNHEGLCKKVCEDLDAYSGTFCLESFDPRCVLWLRRNRPDLVRGQLVENYFKSKTSKLPWLHKFLGANQMLNFLTRPDFVAYKFRDRKNLSDFLVRKVWRAPTVAWTLESKRELNTALSEGRIPIFESFIP